ncbi:MAG: methyltransferase domain-containing protein, partial [Bacilli bacterium]|nr:methyltransferase domain-containing protein [Bacilli bacterium]
YICSIIVGPFYGLLCAIATPIISCFTTGMPNLATLPSMTCELMVYGFTTGLFYRLFNNQKTIVKVYLSLLIAMILGRCTNGVVNAIILSSKYSLKAWVSASFVTAIPGIAIQLVVIPALITSLNSAFSIDIETQNLFGITRRIDNKEVEEFFSEIADSWDQHSSADLKSLEERLRVLKIKENESVLDLGCGTGILENILPRFTNKITGLDISPYMIKNAKEKHPDINYVVGDFYTSVFKNKFDNIIIYNAYPHFIDKPLFVKKVIQVLKKKGKFYLIHGASKEVINQCHKEVPSSISIGLKDVEEELKVFKKYFNVVETHDNENEYIIVLEKK